MIKKKQKISSILLSLALMVLSQNSFADSVVITNKASSVDSLSANEVKALYLQKKKTFSNGNIAIVADQLDGSKIRKEFTKKVLGKSSKKLKRYWSKRVFSGKGNPPKVVGDDLAMKAWVASTPNSLGYISDSIVDDSVKVLLKP